jgi:RNA polymerase sigma-70 factor (ECF subfamily)
VERARSGDRDALELVLSLHYDRIYAVCRRMTGNDADAADAAQETLISVVRGLPRFDGRSRVSTWIYRLAVNASIDELRRRARRPAVGLDSGRESARVGAIAGRSDAPGATTAAGAPLDDLESVPDRVDIDVALRRLPAEFRAAVVLRDLCGLDYAEIAEVLSVPAGTVRSRIARGRALLAKELAPPEVEQ